MISRKRRATSRTGNTKKNYAAQSPEENTEESVEDMLANVETFVDSVYRDLSISPPRSSLSSLANNSHRPIESLDAVSSTSSELNSPVGGSLLSGATLSDESTLAASLVAGRNMENEIQKINQICDRVDQNLRSIGLYMNDCSPSSIPADPNTDFTNLSSTSEPTIISAFIEKVNSNNNTQRRRMSNHNSDAAEVIDLSNSGTERSDIFMQSVRLNNYCGDDDDIILVSDNLPPVVDLCTPNHQNVPRTISRHLQSNRRRRRLSRHMDGVDISCEGPSPSRRHHAEPTFIQPETNKNLITEQTSTIDDANNPKFMCPVCMDSCLENQPTSTVCGHVYCKACIERAIALTHKCPICKKRVSQKQTFRIYV